MKIAIIEPVGGHGGMHYYDFGLCDGLAEAGIDVVLHTCDETEIPKESKFEVRHSYAGIYGQTSAWFRGLKYLRGSIKSILSAQIEGRRICHFHLFHVGILQFFNIAFAKLLRRRIVITAHDVQSFVEKIEIPFMSRWVYRQADWVIAHNKASRQELVERIGLPESRIAVIPHGNYLEAIRPTPPQDEARKLLGIPPNAKVILFFGQIKDVKGLNLLLNAMPGLIKLHPETLLLIAGKPWKSDFSRYEEQILKLGIQEHCICHIRYIPDEKVPFYYAAADVVALPYLRIYQSGVVLMAMSYSKAVVVSNLQGMTEIIKDKVNGFVFDLHSADDLVDKLHLVMSDDSLRNLAATSGYDYIRSHHDWKQIGQKTAQLYNGTSQM